VQAWALRETDDSFGKDNDVHVAWFEMSFSGFPSLVEGSEDNEVVVLEDF
jgi:hypothetical protein